MTVPPLESDLSFGRAIRTSANAQPHFPVLVETVEQALDHVQELPLAILRTSRWYIASEALWSAVDFPQDAGRLKAADDALCRALATEGWLNEAPPR
jgi:hypothetical protein